MKARGKKQRTYQALQSLATAPESVIELFQKLYEAYLSTIRPSKPSKPAEDANVREYLQDGTENDLDAMLRVTVLITDAEAAAMVKQALRYVPHDPQEVVA